MHWRVGSLPTDLMYTWMKSIGLHKRREMRMRMENYVFPSGYSRSAKKITLDSQRLGQFNSASCRMPWAMVTLPRRHSLKMTTSKSL